MIVASGSKKVLQQVVEQLNKLMNDLKGRIYLSARIVGFYSNLFGHKTKFFFLWEDIEDVTVLSPSWSTMGSPALLIILREGRGVDARHGAKCQDDEGRLHFCFHSFVSFNVASRTIMALWRTRMLPPDQKAQIVVEQQEKDEKLPLPEDTTSNLVVEDVQCLKSILQICLSMMRENEVADWKGQEWELYLENLPKSVEASQVLAVTEGVHDVHSIAKEAAALHSSLIQDLSKQWPCERRQGFKTS